MAKSSTGRKHRKELTRGLIGAASAGAVAAATSVLGVLDQPTWKLVVGSAIVAVAGFLIAAAAAATTLRWRIRWLVATCAVLGAFAIFTFWQLRRPAEAPQLASFTVNGTDVQVLYPSGEPGGPQDILPPAPQLIGASTYLFSCYSVVGQGTKQTRWLRLAGYDDWYPLGALHPTPGVAKHAISAC